MAEFSSAPEQPCDVRMRGFAKRATVDDVLAWIDRATEPLPSEVVLLDGLAGRVLSDDICSEVDVPGFDRAMMDGFAVRAADTLGAGPYSRLTLKMIGEVLPGSGSSRSVEHGQAVRIMTGAPIPPGADAVLPAEKAEVAGAQVFALDEVSPGKHVGRRGEDIAVGDRVLARGRRLRPQDLGVLSSMGATCARVVRQPAVRIVVTGNEILPAGSRPDGFLIADANGPMLEALIRRDGGLPISRSLVSDKPDALVSAMCEEVDVVLVSGGSSVGQEDHAPRLLAAHGDLTFHGIAMRPSSPTGMGRLGARLVFLLPGNPVSCLCAYDFFAGRAIRALGGLNREWPYRQVRLPLGRKLVSLVGRVDYARVRIAQGQVEPLAIGGASVLTSTTRADGFVVVPGDSEGYPAGTHVGVWLYD